MAVNGAVNISLFNLAGKTVFLVTMVTESETEF